MIRSVGHPQNHAWHRSHARNYRRAWFLMAGVIGAALLLYTLGDFSSVAWPVLGTAVLETTYRLALAYGIALIIGITVALLVGWSPYADFFFPFFDVLQNLPSFALIPLFIFFFGFTDRMIIFFAVSSIIWPILFAVLNTIKSAHKDLSDAATIFGARGLKRIPYYLAPLAYPSILTGSIVGIAIGWEAVIGAEIITNIAGFGDFIKTASATGITQASIAGTLAILVIVFVLNRIIWAPLLAESAKRYAE
ncbi:MAG: ABC transporter permease subunit [Candidatus Pacebacteria bacterium]|nr:ABC transporter permease subunit [Candidatus Paceibacterota bacterium]